MKSKAIVFFTTILISTGIIAQEKPVKMSSSGICHAPNTTYYDQTKNFTPYKTLDECLNLAEECRKNEEIISTISFIYNRML